MRLAPAPFRPDREDRRPALSVLVLAVLLIWGPVAGGLGAVLPVAAQAGAPFETATVVPADALAYTVVPLDQTSAQWAQAQRLLERAGLGSVLTQLQDDVLADDSEEPFPWELFLGGELAIVVTDTAARLLITEALLAPPPEAAAGTPVADTFGGITESGLAMVVSADAPNFIAVAIRAALTETAEAVGGEVQETDHEGITIEYVEVPIGSDETPLALARVDDFVFVAGFPVDLEPLIETSQGATESLADLDEFDQVRDVLAEEHLAFGYVNPFPSDELRGTLGQMGLPVLYIEGQSAASGFLLAADEAGFRLETVALGTPGAEPVTDLTSAELLARTPDDVLVFVAGSNLAGSGVLDTVGALLLTLSGLAVPDPDAQSLDEQLDAQFAALAQDFGVNPRTEIFQQLTGDYGVWLDLDSPSGAIAALFASGVAEPETVAAALAQITLIVQSGASGELTIVTRPVGEDDRVFLIETGDPTVPRVEYGVVDGQIVVGLGDGMDHVDQPPDPSLADSDRFQTLMAALPEPTSGLVYVDLAQAVPLLDVAAEAEVETITNDIDETTEPAPEEAATPVDAAVPTGDAHPDCAAYATQEEAQAAYDAFAPGSFQLDQDFDGTACEDFFAEALPAATPPLPMATPVAMVPNDPLATPEASRLALTAFGLVAYEEDGNSRTSSLVLIEPGED